MAKKISRKMAKLAKKMVLIPVAVLPMSKKMSKKMKKMSKKLGRRSFGSDCYGPGYTPFENTYPNAVGANYFNNIEPFQVSSNWFYPVGPNNQIQFPEMTVQDPASC